MIVVDTHAWFWWLADPPVLTRAARERLDEEDAVVVPSIALWELAMLADRGRINLDRPTGEFLTRAVQWRGVQVRELTPSIAVRAGQLPRTFHGDPADRLIVATALELECPLVTRDRLIVASGLIDIVIA